MQEPLIRELLGRMLAHRLLIERLIYRLREVDDFQSMGLESDLRKIEADIEAYNLPEGISEACQDELENLGDHVHSGRVAKE